MKTTIKKINYEEGYHSKRHPNHVNTDYYEARAQVALRKFFNNIPHDTNLLDFGCGMGQNIYLMPNAVGYDISEFSLNFCREKGLKVTNDQNDLLDNSYDIVFSSHVLEHHPYPKTMVEEMRSKLKDGSDLILVIPFERHGKASFELDLNQHLYNWNFQNINNLLLSSGFKIKENRYIRGAGYQKLLFLNRISKKLYYHCTNILSRITGIKEMMIVATKV